MEKRFSLRAPEDLLGKFEYIARSEDRSINAQLLRLMKDAVSDYEKHHGPIPYPDESDQ